MVATARFILISVIGRATRAVTTPLSIQECTGRSGQLLETIKTGEFVIFPIRS